MRPHKPYNQHNKPFSHPYQKKPKLPKTQKYRPEPDKQQKLENLQVDIIPNTIDYILSRNFLEDGVGHSDFSLLESLDDRNLPSFCQGYDPMAGVLDNRIDSYELKSRLPTCMTWTPNGKRILVGTSKGKISVLDGSTFSLEYELNIHPTKALKTLCITRKSKYMIASDEDGVLKYLDANYKEVREVRSKPNEPDPVRDISIAPTDQKFVTASEKDKSLKIWDFERGIVEKEFVHGNEINSCQWHPFQSLIASGSKDSTIKFWDPNSGKELASLINHTNSINCIKWNNNGNWLLSCARDQSIRMYDIRMVKEVQAFTGIDSEVEVVSWNPFYERLFTSGTKDGSISFWLTNESNPVSEIKLAHFTEKREMDMHTKRPAVQRGGRIVELVWNPIGDLLASCGNDKTVKFWGRPKDALDFNQQGEANFDEVTKEGMDILDNDNQINYASNDPMNQY